jgi:HNH endonuclease
MAVFSRRKTPPEPQDHYSKYRDLVREDFVECCAYCLLHEIIAAGAGNFQLDHFRPKSFPQFWHLVNDFYNLYYACSICNRYKSNSWPNAQLEAKGYGFIDLCAEDFSIHFREEPNGWWSPLTLRAEYTEKRLRLNRSHLVDIRRRMREIATGWGEAPFDWDTPSREAIRRLFGFS